MSPMIRPGGDDDRNIEASVEASKKARRNSEGRGNNPQSDRKRDPVPTHAARSYGENSRCRWFQDRQIGQRRAILRRFPTSGESLQTISKHCGDFLTKAEPEACMSDASTHSRWRTNPATQATIKNWLRQDRRRIVAFLAHQTGCMAYAAAIAAKTNGYLENWRPQIQRAIGL